MSARTRTNQGTDGAPGEPVARKPRWFSIRALNGHDIDVRLFQTAALRDVLLRRRVIVDNNDW